MCFQLNPDRDLKLKSDIEIQYTLRSVVMYCDINSATPQYVVFVKDEFDQLWVVLAIENGFVFHKQLIIKDL